MGFWPIVKKVIKDSDILVIIGDVRVSGLSRNKTLEKMIRFYKKPFFYVFNKIDLVSINYLDKICSEYKGAFFVSGTKNIGIGNLKKNLLIMAKRGKFIDPKIGIVGYPNVGKSAVINALVKSGKTRVSKKAGATKGIQWVKSGKLLILDSPGVVPFEDSEIKLGIMGSKNPEKLKNVEKVALKIIHMFFKYDKSILEKAYNIKFKDYSDILYKIGKKKGFLLKGGEVDEIRTAMFILRDWQKGKLRF